MELDLSNPDHLEAIKAAGLLTKEDIKEAGYMTSTDVASAGYVKPEDVEAKIKEANAALEANRDSIKTQYQAERDEKKALLDSIAGLDIDKAKEWQKKLQEDELAALVSANDIDGLKKKFTAGLESQLADLQNTVSAKEQEKLQLERELKDQILSIQAEAKQVDIKREINTAMQNIRDQIQPTAFSEIERDALELFDYDDDKKLIIKDGSGVVQVTEDGNLDASGWLKRMIKDKPHRFTGAAGGGNPPSVKTPEKDANGKPLTARQRLEAKRRAEHGK